jgi:hypothetical protein
MEWRERDGVRWLEADLGRGRAAFSTRLGGVSEAPFDRLNLGLLTDDAAAAVAENRQRLAAALGFPPERIAFALQVHGADLLSQEGPGAWPARSFAPPDGKAVANPADGLPEADGQIVTRPGWAGLVFVADCLPVALAGPGGVAILHCGWRGLATGIVSAGAEAVGATRAAIGPGIGPCCYEVGEEVLKAFSGLTADGPKRQPDRAAGPKRLAMDDKSARRPRGIEAGGFLDLAGVARRLLGEAGVGEVESAGLCTSCEQQLFYSHRRDAGRTGRQAGLAWLDREGD